MSNAVLGEQSSRCERVANQSDERYAGLQQEGTSTTFTDSISDERSNVRAYVTEIDHLIELLREGAKSRLEVVSAITLFINGDGELTAEEKARSFDLYMAEIEAVEAADSKRKSKGRAAGERTSKGEKLAQILASGRDNRKEEEPVDAESLSSTDSEEDETSRKRRKLRQSDMPWFG
jgi:hypothetical protein